MGWLKEYPRRGGGTTYYAMYRDRQGKERSAGAFSTERAGNKAWQKAEADLAAGRLGDPSSGRQRVRDYVEDVWFPHHVLELTTRETYRYQLDRRILPRFGDHRMDDVMPADVRAWVLDLTEEGVGAPTIKRCKQILDAIFTTAVNDQVTVLHPGRGVRTPPVKRKPKTILTTEQFDTLHSCLGAPAWQVMVETDIETGLRWGELTELRVRDCDLDAAMLTISRVVVELKAKNRAGPRFVVKEYPKNKDYRHIALTEYLRDSLRQHIDTHTLAPDDLLFSMHLASLPGHRRPVALPDPETLGTTEPNASGRTYRHGTLTAYQLGPCRCQHCRDAVAAYRATRRATGKDSPRRARRPASDADGHISGDWFRRNVWAKALTAANITDHVTPHGMRHTHASWLLAAGTDLQTVRERLGHASIGTTEGYLHALPSAQSQAVAALTAIRGHTPNPASSAGASPTIGHAAIAETSSVDPRDVELAELRAVVGQLKGILQA